MIKLTVPCGVFDHYGTVYSVGPCSVCSCACAGCQLIINHYSNDLKVAVRSKEVNKCANKDSEEEEGTLLKMD